jgi:uncharacterized protein (TIGR02231 family)
MKKTILTLAALFVVFITIDAQSEKEIKAEIRHVTVFPDRAQITHESSVSISSGKSIIRLAGLSPYIDAQSVQVKGVGEFTILSVNQQNNYLQNLEDSPEMKNIRSQIESLQLKVEDETAAIETLRAKESFLVANQAILVKGTTISIEQMKNVMDLYTNSIDQVTTLKLKKNRLIKDYSKQIAALQQQISEKLGRQQLPSGEITVSVSSEKPVTGKLLFNYVVMNAGWYPSYDIRVQDIKNPVAISYKANVFQSTGVEWKDVKLSVSNASADITGDVPAFSTWFIDYYNPAPMMMMRSAGAAKAEEVEMVSADQVAKMNARPLAAAPPPVEKQIGETTVTFDIAIPYTIASDGKVQTVEIQQIEAPAEYKYVSLPKLSPLAYLTANITDWAKLSLQSGEATLYFENSFVGKSNLNVNQLSDTLAISLGTDNSILVKREKRKDFTSRKVLGSNKTDTYSYLITVRNNKQVPVKMTLRDQIPVSTNSGITVEAVELSGGRHNTYTGEISWDIDIKQQETKQIILTFSVKYPKDRTIVID